MLYYFNHRYSITPMHRLAIKKDTWIYALADISVTVLLKCWIIFESMDAHEITSNIHAHILDARFVFIARTHIPYTGTHIAFTHFP